MRLLYLSRLDDMTSRYSMANLLAELFRAMLDDDETLSIMVTTPRGHPTGEFEAAVGHHDRLLCVPAIPESNPRHMTYVSTEEIGRLLGQVRTPMPYDVVVNCQPGLTPLYWNALANRYQQGRWQTNVPVISHMMMSATEYMQRVVPGQVHGDLDLLAEGLAALYGTTVWESRGLLADHLATVERWMTGSVRREVSLRSRVIPHGVDCSRLADMERPERDRPRLFWGGRLSVDKGWEPAAEVMNRIGTLGHDVMASTMYEVDRPQVQEALERWPMIRLRPEQGRLDWFRLLAEADVAPCFSPHESYGAGWLEMLAAGVLVVFKRAKWIDDLLPVWYPWVFDSAQQVEAACLQLLKTWDSEEVAFQRTRIREWVASEHDSTENGRKFGDLVTKLALEGIQGDERFARSGISVLANEAAENCRDVTLDAVCTEMSARSESGREFGKVGDMMTPMYLRRCLQVGGWTDVGDVSTVRFVR